jgi:predicted ATPase
MAGDPGKNNSADDLKNVSIKIKNYMCFRDTPQGFESIKPINIIIGRNNSGKSRLLDMLQFAVDEKKLENQRRDEKDSEIIMSFPLIESELKAVFPETTRSNVYHNTYWDFGKKHIGNKITISIKYVPTSGRLAIKREFISLDPPFAGSFDGNIEQKKDELFLSVRNPFKGKIVRKINAERDMWLEQSGDRRVQENGNGATNLMRVFWHHADYLKKFVSKDFLKNLNEIASPDVYFEEINLKEHGDGRWEVFLNEKEKGIVPLSNSGSGLKTILLVLINILLVPVQEGIKLDKYIFIFEELENNLHPAIQRRLLSYIRKIALEKNATFFITTHSNVVIDLFSKDANAQIYHIIQENGEIELKHVTTYIEDFEYRCISNL